eukprot:c19906_g1_i1 orf=537-4184(+)
MMERAGGWQLSLQDWEQIFYDFKGRNRSKWLSQYPGLAILEQALYIVAKKDYPFKPQLLAFIEENIEVLIGDDDTEEGLGSVVEALRTVLESPPDGLNAASLLKEQMMTTATVALVVLDGLHRALHHLQVLVEVLLGVINRPNHSLDRQARGSACECLRELEKAYPCLLNACAGHILFLFQSERTHVAQSYTLLLTTILHNLACYMYTIPGSRSGGTSSFLSTSAPLTPFTVPSFLVTSDPGEEALSVPARELTPSILKEFRRVVGLLLERPQLLTSIGMLEFVSSLIDIAAALELHGSILKVQLYNLMYTYSPLLCHVVLMIYFHFTDSFEGEEGAIYKRVNLLCNDPQQPLMVRLLAIHWLLGLEDFLLRKEKKPCLASMASSMYPQIYDPLSLKALKLDALAHCATFMQSMGESFESKQLSGELNLPCVQEGEVASKLFKDGAVCLSAFHWLPSWSSETRLMFRMMHRFLTVEVMDSPSKAPDVVEPFNSILFKTLEARLVSLALQLRRLVPCLLMLVDRLLLCETHKALGQHLLQIFNRDLLSQLTSDKHLPAHFPIFERIAENGSIPPGGIVDLLTAYARNQVAAVGTESLSLWVRGSQVLLICRIIMVHHYSSRAFHPLSNLLAFLVFYFPDIEVQDSARTYLRMLVSIPGKKLRTILKYGDEQIEDPKYSQVSSLLQATPPSPGYKKPLQVASYIHLSRATALLVGQSWSLVLHDLFQSEGKSTDKNVELSTPVPGKEEDPITEIEVQEEGEDESLPQGDRVLDGTSEIKEEIDSPKEVKILQEHFSLIPDYVNGPGLKVRVQCYLKFKADAQPLHTEEDSPRSMISGPSFSESWPALYAVVLSFSTSGPYGDIPSVHIPFLLSGPPDATKETADEGSSSSQLQIVQHQTESDVRAMVDTEEVPEVKTKPQAEMGLRGEAAKDGTPEPEGKEKSEFDTGHDSTDGSSTSEQLDEDAFKESIVLELQPKQPVPTIIDTHVVTSDEDGRRIHGQLDSIPVGIEDLFAKALLPSQVSPSDSSVYYFNLFNALWEACDKAGRLHTESFALHGGKAFVSVAGTESVKLLESRADRVVDAVEHYLSPFVVSAKGDKLVSILKDSDMLKDVVWQEDSEHGNRRAGHLAITYGLPMDGISDQLYDSRGQADVDLPPPEAVRENIGSLCILIFLPPRFHILLKMDIADWSTLVHIRTDYWPCLAYVDEYLEALVSSR